MPSTVERHPTASNPPRDPRITANPRERPPEQPRQRRHPERRAQPEERHVGEPRRRRRQRREHERRQRAAAGEAVNRADNQRTPRQRPRADVHVRRRPRVHVNARAVMMHVRRTGRALPRRQIDRAQPEADQHYRDAEFERRRHRRRHLRAQQDEDRADRDQREGVSQSPAGAEKRRLVAAAFAGDQCRHRGEVIRFERVPHAEQRAEARAGHEFENGHGGGLLSHERVLLFT